MILSMESAVRIVFLIYGAFWVTVLIVLFVAVGMLMRRAERKTAGHAHATPGGGH